MTTATVAETGASTGSISSESDVDDANGTDENHMRQPDTIFPRQQVRLLFDRNHEEPSASLICAAI